MFELIIILTFFVLPMVATIAFAVSQIREFDESCKRQRYDAEDYRVEK